MNPNAIQTLLSLKIRMEGNRPIASLSATAPGPPSDPVAIAREDDAITLLVDAFIDAAAVPGTAKEQRKRKGDLHFLSSVFANITVTPAGRLSMLSVRKQTQEFLLSGLLSFTEHPDPIRRGGIASTLKNCAFYTPAHVALLKPEDEMTTIPPDPAEAKGMNLLSFILLPLAGPEEFDLEACLAPSHHMPCDIDKLPASIQFLPSTKKREADPFIRLAHIETLLLLCTTRPAREYMRAKGVYEVVQKMHETEENVPVMEHIERLVNFLKRDEGAEIEEGTSANRTTTGGDEDEDDVIVEI
ncbi:hypothetical protein FRC10_005897 [Ceratobasidium sp. 414]|nr:hypothetical protein FRC10_005897 [Ceratobasidium sp. 414]